MQVAANTTSFLKYSQHVFKALTFVFNFTAYHWPLPAHVPDGAKFDFILIGGGTNGCTLASHLVKSGQKVLVIEAGGQGPLESVLPYTFGYLKNTDYDWNLTSVPNEINNRYQKEHVTHMQQGKVLGGSSQVNYMFYGVGNPNDYDEWASITNDSSWSYENVLPLFKKTEKVIDKTILNSKDKKFHGTKGQIEIKKYHPDSNKEIYESYKELGNEIVNDVNPEHPLGYTASYFAIGTYYRRSTAYSYLSPVKYNHNLHVMYNSLATKIIFDENKRAVGVKILTKDNKYITVRAKKEIIVTAGAIKTPQLLMLSGIGPKTHLESKGIEVISDLPVGKNFQDNPLCTLHFKMGEAKPSLPPNPHEFPAKCVEGYVALNKSQKIPDYLVLSAFLTKEFYIKICTFTFKYIDSVCDSIYQNLSSRQMYFVTISLLHAASRGEILLNSTDPEDQPIINPRYYSEEEDLDKHAKYIEHHNEVLGTKYFKSVDAELIYPKLEGCDDIQHGTHEYWKCYVRAMSTTLHTYVGTCAMGSVVDSQLCVKGVKGLRVADSSVMPKIVSSTVQASVIMIAQKAFNLIAKDHHLTLHCQ